MNEIDLNKIHIVNPRGNDTLRIAYSKFLTEAFGVTFEEWYRQGFWQSQHNPHCAIVGEEVIANISANDMYMEMNGIQKHYVQVGGVTTAPELRGKGLSRQLMLQVLDEYKDCDGIYLYANDSVLDFYPKFGFHAVTEYKYRAKADRVIRQQAKSMKVTKVPMNSVADFKAFIEAKKERTSSALVKLHTDELLAFYLLQYMQECVYYIEDLDCYVIAEIEGNNLLVEDIYSKEPVNLLLAATAVFPDVEEIDFDFTPMNTTGLEKYEFHEEDTTLFVLQPKMIEDMKTILSFPRISHT